MPRSRVRFLDGVLTLGVCVVSLASPLAARAGAAPVLTADAPKGAATAPAAVAAANAWEKLGLPHYVPPAAYSEDLVINAEGKTFTMKRAIDGARSRTDMSADGTNMVMIELGDERGTSYQLMPDRKMAIKQSRASMDEAMGGRLTRAQAEHAKKAETAAAEPAAPADVKVEDLGDDPVNGAPARKVRMTSSDGEVLGWFEKSTGAPLRMEGTSDGKKATIEWKNRKLEPQPAALFEVPKNYELQDMDEMMEKAKGMGAMGGMLSGAMSGAMGGMGSNIGGSFGAGLGASLGGPLGAMAGQYIGGRVGGMIGRRAAGVVP